MDDMIGRLVVSLAGRDKGSICVVTGLSDDKDYVFIADGRIRKVEAPKKKKLKHVSPVDWIPEEQRRIAETRFTNRSVREAVAQIPPKETAPDKQ